VVEVTISLSNLFKQYNVINADVHTRVINSDDRLADRFRKQEAEAQETATQQEQESPEQESAEQEFSAGIEAPKVDLEAIRQEALESAREEAERITAEAQAQAQQFLQDAEQQAQVMLAEQKQLGYEQGLAEAKEEFQQKSDELEEDMRVKKQELFDNYEKKMTGMESDMVDAIIHVFDKVFNIQFEDKRDILMALVNNTLMDVDAGDKIRIHASEADYPMFQEHLDEIQEKVGPDVSVEFVRDSSLSAGECQIETPFGVFDCGVDTELAGLLKDIRSLA
jgi:flagellar assembly protein FliH